MQFLDRLQDAERLMVRRDFNGVKTITAELLEMESVDAKQWTTAAAVLYLQAAYETGSLQEAQNLLLGEDENYKNLEPDVIIVWYDTEKILEAELLKAAEQQNDSEALLAEYLKRQECDSSNDVTKIRSYMEKLARGLPTHPIGKSNVDRSQLPQRDVHQSLTSKGSNFNPIPHQMVSKEGENIRVSSNPQPKASDNVQIISHFQLNALARSFLWGAAMGMGALFAYAVGKETVLWRRQLR